MSAAVMNTAKRIKAGLPEAMARIERIEKALLRMETEMSKLEKMGIIEATPYFHQGKYLYMVFPMVRGQRSRRYIGSDRAKIADAHAAVERAKKYRELEAELNNYGRALYEAGSALDRFFYHLPTIEE